MKKSPQHIHFGVHIEARSDPKGKTIKRLKIHIEGDGVENSGKN